MRIFIGGPLPDVPRRLLNPVLKSRLYPVVEDPSDADCFMLATLWDSSKVDELAQLSRHAQRRNSDVIVFAGGDFEPILPISNAALFHPGPIRGAAHPYKVKASPYFSDDLLTRYAGGLQVRKKEQTPSVGFCGQATLRPTAEIAVPARGAVWHLRSKVGLLPFVPPPLRGHMNIRRRALRVLHESSLVDDSFLVRDRYRAGINGPERRGHPTTLQFVQNITETDYTLCIRGSGNFSARFYETLCLGRIPVLVDTDCILPAETVIPWEHYIVRVDVRDMDHLPERIAEFHRSLEATEFEEHQRACRRLWEEWFRETTYAANFRKELA